MNKFKARLLGLMHWAKDRLTLKHNEIVITQLLNKNINANISKDEAEILKQLENSMGLSPNITRKGKVIFKMPYIDNVPFGRVMEARRCAGKGKVREMIAAYTGKDSIIHVGDVLVASKWIGAQLIQADNFEKSIFGFGGEQISGVIDEACSELNMLQIIAEAMNIKTEEARGILYKDAIICLINKKKEYDRQAKEIAKYSRAAL